VRVINNRHTKERKARQSIAGALIRSSFRRVSRAVGVPGYILGCV
jgi:hypothetical protein